MSLDVDIDHARDNFRIAARFCRRARLDGAVRPVGRGQDDA